MTTVERFMNFFSEVIIGKPKNDEDEKLKKALSTIKSSSIVENIRTSLVDETLNYENTNIQEINSNQTINIDCGSKPLLPWQYEEYKHMYDLFGNKIPYTGCVKYGCCYDIDQQSKISLVSNNTITRVQKDEMYEKITSEIKQNVRLVVGDDKKVFDILEECITNVRSSSYLIIDRHIENMNNISVDGEQTITITSLLPLMCKNKCNERQTAGRVSQYINLEITSENIISDIIQRISDSFVEISQISDVSITVVNIKELYLFAFGTVLILVTIYIICYVIALLLWKLIAKTKPPTSLIIHFIAIILFILAYIFMSMVICVIRSGGGISAVFCLF